jgi:hypothetical protein
MRKVVRWNDDDSITHKRQHMRGYVIAPLHIFINGIYIKKNVKMCAYIYIYIMWSNKHVEIAYTHKRISSQNV